MSKSFDESFASLPGRGWLSREEAALLWLAAVGSGGDVLEVGSYRGRSACLLLDALASRPDAKERPRRLVCCDPLVENFDGEDTGPAEDIRAELLSNLSSRETQGGGVSWRFFRLRDEDFHDTLTPPDRFGVVYLDGDHSYEGTLGALRRWVPRSTGFVAVHDYGMCASLADVKRAVDDSGRPVLRRAGSMALLKGTG